MKKIMFNDKYGLTDAVLQGRKTMTRRMVKDGTPLGNWGETEKYAKYKIGEVVAVAQSYKSIFEESLNYVIPRYHWLDDHIDKKGYANKMFVKASEMPHHIRITDIKVERLQDISEEDCLKEGIFAGELKHEQPKSYVDTYLPYGCYVPFTFHGAKQDYTSAKEAFASLINRPGVGRKGLWEENPWVFAYSFELVK